MNRLGWTASLLTAGFLAAGACLADGLESAGNTDGHVTWRLGELTAGQSATRVVILAWADSHEKLLKLLDAARPQLMLAVEEKMGQRVDQVSFDDIDQVPTAAAGFTLAAQPIETGVGDLQLEAKALLQVLLEAREFAPQDLPPNVGAIGIALI